MEFFCYRRDRPGSVALRDELLEEHWSSMDRYAAQLIARGPPLANDGDTPTGSMHIADLPDPVAAPRVRLRRWSVSVGGRSSLAKVLVAYLSTALRPSSLVMLVFERPSAMRRSTCSSRGQGRLMGFGVHSEAFSTERVCNVTFLT